MGEAAVLASPLVVLADGWYALTDSTSALDVSANPVLVFAFAVLCVLSALLPHAAIRPAKQVADSAFKKVE